MTKRVLKTLLLPIAAMATAFAFIACDDGATPDAKFKVTYEIGADAQGTAPTETDKAAGEKFKVKSDDGFYRTGWDFTGWSDGSRTYQPDEVYTMPSKAVKFTAQWDPDGETVKYSVTYNLNGGSGTVPTETDKAEGEKFTLKSDDGITAPAGKEFKGWNDGTATYKAGVEYEMQDSAVVFTAQWGNEGAEEPDSIYSALELEYKGYIYLYDGGTGKFDYKDANDDVKEVSFTYTLNGTAIAISFGGNTYNGTYVVNGANKLLTIQFTYKSMLFKYGAAEEPPTGKPTVTFDANGGTGTAPVIADADITATTNNQYNIVLPQCEYTAPNGKEFNKWEVISGTKSLGTYSAGSTFRANAGEKITLKATWKDATAETPTGTEYFGNCHISVDGGAAMSDSFTVKAIMFDVAKGKMFYRIDDSLTYVKSKSVQSQDSDRNKPNDYGANAKFYEVRIENAAVYLLLDADNKLKLFDTNFDPYDNGEFRIIDLNPTDYTITFDPRNEEDTWEVTVSTNETVQKPQTNPVHPGGKTFRYWKYHDPVDDTDKEYKFGNAPTGNITLTAVYAWELTFSAGEGNGTIDPMYVEQWTGAGVTLPDASDLNNGSKIFAGWWDGTYEDDEQTVKNIYDAGDRYVGTGNVTLTAQWKVDNSFVVGFVRAVWYSDRSKVTGDDPDLPNKIEAGTTFKAPANTYTLAGKEFDGWQLHEFSASTELGALLGEYAVGEDIIMPAKPVQLVAKWKEIKTSATVTYKAGAHGTGANVVETNVNFSTTYQLIENPFTVDNFYTFTGWKVEGDNSDSDPLTGKYNLTDDVVFVAQYANMYYSSDNDDSSKIYLLFNTSAGILYYGEDTEVMLTVSTSGTDITITPEGGAACTGTFVNNTLNIELTVSGTKYTFGEPNADTTAYTVTYVLGDGVTGTVPTETDKVAGEKFTLAAGTGLVNGDQEFAGWSDGTTTYKAGVEYTMPNHAVTLTAQWKSNAPLTWESIDPESGALFNFVNSCPNKEAIYLFDNSFVVGDYTFVGLQFYVASYTTLNGSSQRIHAQPIYYKTVDGKSATKIGSGLPCKPVENTDEYKLRFTSSSGSTYAIEVQKCGSSYYVTKFKYGSANPEVAMQVELEYTTKTLNDLKAG